MLSTLTESGPLTQIELATTMSSTAPRWFTCSTSSKTSLVERVRSPQDRRAFLIHLTPARAHAARPLAAPTLLTLHAPTPAPD